MARRQARDDPLREAGTPRPSAIDAPPNGSAARSFQIAASGAPRGVRMVAQSIRAASWLNGSGPIPPRLAALRCPSSINARGNAGGIWRAFLLPSGEKVSAKQTDERRTRAGARRPSSVSAARCHLLPRGEKERECAAPLNPPSSSFRRRSPSFSDWRRRRP